MDKYLSLYRLVNGQPQPFPSADGQIILSSFTLTTQRMGAAPSITATVKYTQCLDGQWNDVFVTFGGERFFVRKAPDSEKNSTDDRYEHSVTFVSERSILDNIYMVDAVRAGDTADGYKSNDTRVIFSGDIAQWRDRLNAALEYAGLYDTETDTGYRAVVDNGISTEDRLVSFDEKYFSEALQEGFTAFGVPYYFVKNGSVTEIHLGFSEDDIDSEVKYGHDAALTGIGMKNSGIRTANRMSGYGSSDNIPYYYPNETPIGNDVSAEVAKGTDSTLSASVRSNERLSVSIPRFPLTYGDGGFAPSGTTILTTIELTEKEIKPATTGLIFKGGSKTLENITVDVDAQSFVRISMDGVSWEVITERSTHSSQVVYRWESSVYPPSIDSITSAVMRSAGGTEYDVLNGAVLPAGTYDLTISFHVKLGKYIDSPRTYTTCTVSGQIAVMMDKGAWRDSSRKEVDPYNVGITVTGVPAKGDTISLSATSRVEPINRLMPPIYRESGGTNRFYDAENHDPEVPDSGYPIPGTSPVEYYHFDNTVPENPKNELIQEFSDIKPTIAGMVNGSAQRIDMFLAVAFDQNDSDEKDENGEYAHPYFFVKLPRTDGDYAFNLFDCALDTPMTLSMTSGACGACKFEISVDADTKKNTVQVDASGNLMRNADGDVICGRKGQGKVPFQPSQQDTSAGEVWIALKKDNSTFPSVMPSAPKIGYSGIRPSVGDTFVILNINMPQAYIVAAEQRLENAIIAQMALVNSPIFNPTITFSRIFLEQNADFLENLNVNSRLTNIVYNGTSYGFYISQMTYSMAEGEILPDVSVKLVTELVTSSNALDTRLEAMKQGILGSVAQSIAGIQYERVFLRKDVADTAAGAITFLDSIIARKDIRIGEDGSYLLSRYEESGAEIGLHFGSADLHTFIEGAKLILRAGNATLSLSPDGYVGINKSNPEHTLDVEGDIVGSTGVAAGGITDPSSSGGGGTTDHSELDNLEYANSGHTGFQPTIDITHKLAYSLIEGTPTSLPASDVYPWAKAATKPSYTLDEITDGTNRKWADKQDKITDVTDTESGYVSKVTQTSGRIGVTHKTFAKAIVTITGGTTAGPTIKVKADGAESDAKTIPSAGASASGVVTTGAQTFGGDKTFTGFVHSDKDVIGSTGVAAGGITDPTSSGGGVSNYNDLDDRPLINGEVLVGGESISLQPTISDLATIRANASAGKTASDNLALHIADTNNPHTVTKGQVGLGNVDNTADANKNVLSAAKLTTARTLWGVSFDGSANITTAPDLYIGTTKVQTSSATQNLTGIGTLTTSNKVTIGGGGLDVTGDIIAHSNIVLGDSTSNRSLYAYYLENDPIQMVGYNPDQGRIHFGYGAWAKEKAVTLEGNTIQFLSAAGTSHTMNFDASGNLGINVAAPQHRLDVGGDIFASAQIVGQTGVAAGGITDPDSSGGGGGGSVDAVKVNGVTYNPDASGVVELPNYYTKTESDTKYATKTALQTTNIAVGALDTRLTADEANISGMSSDIYTLKGYFTTGKANDSLKLGGHDSSYFAIATHTHDYLPLTGGTINGELFIKGDLDLRNYGVEIEPVAKGVTFWAVDTESNYKGLYLNVTDGSIQFDDVELATQSWVEAKGYITAAALTGYATQSWVQSQGYLTAASFDNYYTKAQSNERFSVVDGLTAPPASSREGKPGDFAAVRQNNVYSLYACFGQVYTTSWLWNQVALISDIPSVSGFLTQTAADARYSQLGHTHSYLPLSGGTITGTTIAIDSAGLPTYGGSRVPANTLAIGRNGIGIGGIDTSNDGAAIYMENAGTEKNHLIIALGDDATQLGADDYIAFRYYNTSGQATYESKIPFKSGTIALTSDIPDVSGYLPKSGGTMTGSLTLGTHDLIFSGSDQGDIIWYDGSGAEKHRLWGAGADGSLYYRYYGGAANLIWHQGNLTNNNQLSNGAGYITSSGSCAYASSAGNADTIGSYTIQQVTELTYTIRDFTAGTLVRTNINYAVTGGDSFYLEIKGNTYSEAIYSCFTQVQGYIYYDTIIAYGVTHLGVLKITPIVAMNIGGNLCFWFPRLGYWMGFSVRCYRGTNYAINTVTSIENSADPGGAKRVILTANSVTTINSNNYTSYCATTSHTHSYLPLSGGTMTGTPYIYMPDSGASIPNSQPFGITYGKIGCYGSLGINADTDGSTNEYLVLTSGYGYNTNTAYGLAIGYNSLTWKNNTIYHSGNLTAATLGAMTQSAADARYWRPDVARLASGVLSLSGGLIMLSNITTSGINDIGTSSDRFRSVYANIINVSSRIEKNGYYFRRYLGVYQQTELPGSSVAEIGDYAIAQVYTTTFVFAIYATAGGRTGWWSTGQISAI